MIKHNGIKVAALAASIALAMAGTSAMAGTVTKLQLPGQGAVVAGSANAGTVTSGVQSITIAGNTVIDWGVASSATINTAQTGGFNIGSGANLSFIGTSKADSVLNVDISGNPSQILGTLSMTGGGNLYVANANGIIVGAGASISNAGGAVGLIANTLGDTTNFNGTADADSIEYAGKGGNVSVATGASINGSTVLVSGGNTVNVDLSAITGGAATLEAGIFNSNSTLLSNNSAASLSVTGALPANGGSLAAFESAGNASISATGTSISPSGTSEDNTVTLGGNTVVDGTLTVANDGNVTMGATTATGSIAALVNNGIVTQAGNLSLGGLTNNGAWAAYDYTLNVGGNITNNGSMLGLAELSAGGEGVAGSLTNNGQITGNGTLSSYGNFTNNGQITGDGGTNVVQIQVYGGNLLNKGSLASPNITVNDGSLINSGTLTDAYSLTTQSSAADQAYTAGADYSISNTGTIDATSDLQIQAGWRTDKNPALNTSTGSINNTGTLNVGNNGILALVANNNVSLAGTVQALDSQNAYSALSATNPLSMLYVLAGGETPNSSAPLNAAGNAMVATTTDLYAKNGFAIDGSMVSVYSNLTSPGQTQIVAGAAPTSGYAVRVAAGKTISSSGISINGDKAGDTPNVIVQGTLNANQIALGQNFAVGDVFTGPGGSLSLAKLNGYANFVALYINSTGRVKTVPYNNASNFRFNGLNVVTDGTPLTLLLNPSAYTTNGTSNGLSAYNVLVSGGDVNLISDVPMASVDPNGLAVTGSSSVPNTHLVLQSTGNISVGSALGTNGSATGSFYWPGYVYLGNIATNASGAALPGTLGLGTITTNGTFSNVLPGNIGGADGIHFITQFPLNLGGNVITNANAWVNFGSALLTQKYATGQAGSGINGFYFYAGQQGAGTVVNYGQMDPSLFVTQVPSATL